MATPTHCGRPMERRGEADGVTLYRCTCGAIKTKR